MSLVRELPPRRLYAVATPLASLREGGVPAQTAINSYNIIIMQAIVNTEFLTTIPLKL